MKNLYLYFFIFKITLIKIIKAQFEYLTIGAIKDNSVRIKAKSTTLDEVQIKLNNITKESKLKKDSDGYFDIIVTDLKPNTNYTIDLVSEKPLNINFNIKTLPQLNSTTAIDDKINFVTTSFSKSSSNKNSWGKIKSLKPNFFIMLGNMYDEEVKSTSWKDYEKVFLNSKKKSKNLI